jgi:hypothetical protein
MQLEERGGARAGGTGLDWGESLSIQSTVLTIFIQVSPLRQSSCLLLNGSVNGGDDVSSGLRSVDTGR